MRRAAVGCTNLQFRPYGVPPLAIPTFLYVCGMRGIVERSGIKHRQISKLHN